MGAIRGLHNLPLKLVLLALAVALAVGVGGPAASAQDGQLPWMNPSLSPAQRADLLLGAMTLDQKLQQIYNLPVYNEDLDDGDPDNGVGCDFQRVGRHIEGIPALAIPTFRFANGGTGIRGGDCLPEPTATGLPSQVASAATFDPATDFAWGQVLDNEIYGWAHQVLWGPAFNMIRTPWGGRNHEYMSEDPYLTGVTATELVRGVQASKRTHATIKHFAANESEFEMERWTAGARVPSRALHELYLLPFEMSVRDAKPASIMCAFTHLNFDWGCENIPLLQQTLRRRWGFDGYVVSDRRAMHSTVQSILAGTGFELDFEPDFYTPERIRAAISAGLISEANIDALLRDRYIKMFEFGHFDHPERYTSFNFDEVTPAANNRVARRAADESITLLKNENRTLPLNIDNSGDIAVIGMEWFAGQATMPPRSGDETELSNVVTDPDLTVSPEEGLENTLQSLGVSSGAADDRVTYNDATDLDSAVELAEGSDTVVLMVGDNPRETDDVDALSLPTLPSEDDEDAVDQGELVPAILDANPHTIVVLKTQGMVLMPWLDDALAVVEAWYPGQQDGNAVADMLFGVTNPSGKLPVTFGNTDHEAAYSSTAQYPGLREDNGLGGSGPFEGPAGLPQLVTHYTEGLEMGYRWYLANHVPSVFPFGHGLSYTTFEYSDLALSVAGGTGGRTVVNATYTVTNAGTRAGKEASQVYLTLPRSANEPPKRLVGFRKVNLRPGESTRVTVTIDSAASNHPLSYFVPDNPEDLRAWADGDWATAPGQYTVHVGTSSVRTPLRGTFTLAGPPQPSPPAAGGGGGQGTAPADEVGFRGRLDGRVNRRRFVRIRVFCPLSAGPAGCEGTLTAKRGPRGDRTRVARKRFSIPAGRVSKVRLRLNRKAFRRLERRDAMRVRLSVRIRLDDGTVQKANRTIRLRAPRGR